MLVVIIVVAIAIMVLITIFMGERVNGAITNPIIQRDNIVLKPIKPSDHIHVRELTSDVDVVKYYTMDGEPWTRSRTRDYMARAMHGYEYSIHYGGEFAGIIGIMDDRAVIDTGINTGVGDDGGEVDDNGDGGGKTCGKTCGKTRGKFIHICLSKKFWGKGIASTAIALITSQYARDHGRYIAPIYAKIHPDNTASIRVHEKNGFELVAVDNNLIYAKNA
jgi:RimJ/RimL family protein N-acetyltransferase